MILEWREPDGWVLKIGRVPQAVANAIGDLVHAFERSRRGGFIDALLAMAERRRSRGYKPGKTVLELSEGGGDPMTRAADWGASCETIERRAKATADSGSADGPTTA